MTKMKKDKVLEKIGDAIKESFPFYVSYNLNKSTKYGQGYELDIKYYYMGEQVILTRFIHRYELESLERIEIILDEIKDFLLDVRKDLISYPENETQQDFLRKER